MSQRNKYRNSSAINYTMPGNKFIIIYFITRLYCKKDKPGQVNNEMKEEA